MPKKGPAIPTSKEWKSRVMQRIDEMGISQNELARRAHISKAAISQALAPDSMQTTVMAEIHKVLGWDPPPTQFSPDAMELLALYEQMGDRDQGELLGELKTKLRSAKTAAELRKRRNQE